MKIKPSDIPRLLRDLAQSQWRVLFLHGSDIGLISERAKEASLCVAGNNPDPFAVISLEPGESDRFEEEARSFSLLGGRRIIRQRGAEDTLIASLERVLAQESDAFLILEAGSGKIKKLQAFAEKHPKIASIGCYSEERSITQTILQMLKSENITIESDALAWLKAHLASDQLLVKRELEKICLYARPQTSLNLEDIRQAIGDTGGSSLEDALYAALSGDRALADLALERAFSDGIGAIHFTRSTLMLLEKIQIAAWAVKEGKSHREAVESLRPPIFFKRKDAFLQILRRWKSEALGMMLAQTQELEYQCKSRLGAAGSDFDLLLCRRHLVKLCYKYTA